MSAAHVRRGGADARQAAQGRAQGRRAQEDRQAAAGRPGARQQARRPGLRRLPARDRARRRWSRSTFRPRPSARPARRSARPASPSAATRSSASTTWTAALIDAVVTDELHRAADEAGTAKAPQPLVDVAAHPRAAAAASAGSRTRACRAACPTRWSSTSSSARRPRCGRTSGQLALIDAEGVVLDRVPVDKMPDLPLLIGPGANAPGARARAR